MKSKKQSSIEWLINEIPVIDWQDPYWKVLLVKAKELHKQEIIDAYEMGFADGWNDVKYDNPQYSDSEQYYLENYED